MSDITRKAAMEMQRGVRDSRAWVLWPWPQVVLTCSVTPAVSQCWVLLLVVPFTNWQIGLSVARK